MKIKKIIKYLIINFFLKTKIFLLFEKRIFKYRRLKIENKSIIPFLKKNTILDHFLVTSIYFNRYYRNLKDQTKQEAITISTLSNGEGRYWAEYYYRNSVGDNHRQNREIIYKKTVDLIDEYNLDNSFVYFINLGSSSGLDLLYFMKKFKNINYISSDINEEIIDFQKKNTFRNNLNIEYIAGSVEKIIIEIIKKLTTNHNTKFIFFCNGTIQYVLPFKLKQMFDNLKKFNNHLYFIASEQFRNEKNVSSSFHVKNILWHHDIKKFVEENNFEIMFYKIINSGNDTVNQNQNIIFHNNFKI